VPEVPHHLVANDDHVLPMFAAHCNCNVTDDGADHDWRQHICRAGRRAVIVLEPQWSYDGTTGVMSLLDEFGGAALDLKVSIPEAHALGNYIKSRVKFARQSERRALLEEIANLHRF